MSERNSKSEGGHKHGHSRMDHRDRTAKVKAKARKARRRNDKRTTTREA